MSDYDAIVIGSGSGGLTAALGPRFSCHSGAVPQRIRREPLSDQSSGSRGIDISRAARAMRSS